MTNPLRSCRVAAWLFALAAVPSLASTGAAAVADHLLLTEIVVQTRLVGSVPTGSKYIEIVNPTSSAIDLSNVYVTDATTSPSTYYYNIVKLNATGGGGTGGDFNARFPDGASIAPGDTIVVSIVGSNDYQLAYGRLPDYELFEDGTVPDQVPDMVEAFPGSIGRGLGSTGTNVPDLTPTGESVVLYRWDGLSDLVEDLDYAIWGTITSVRVNKTGVRIDGPDAGTDSTAYKPDTDVVLQIPIATAAHNYGNSFQRRSLEESYGAVGETLTGGNGLTGHNETSEPLNQTWVSTLPATPPAAPAAFTPPAPIFTNVILAPPTPHAGQAASVTATLLAYTGNPVTGATLHWSVDGVTYHDVTCENTTGDVWSAEIPAQDEGATVRWYLLATASGGGRSTKPPAAPAYTQSYLVGPAPVYPPKLLISEVCVSNSSQEFIEVANPTDQEVDLSNYYLTDAIHQPASEYYWKIVLPNPDANSIGGGVFNDFHSRFPNGAKIPAHGVVTISLPSPDTFAGSYGVAPDFELVKGATADPAHDMREVFPGSINGTTAPTLSDAGEIVVLYYWDGQSDLVFDIDVFMWGTGTTYRFDKTGVCIDGPDADTTPSCYQPDTPVGAQRPCLAVPGGGQSFQRKDATESTERKTGGNGTLGYDETSEDWNTAFVVTASTPGFWEAGAGPGVTLPIELQVPARTFLPLQGESFPVKFRSQPGAETKLRIFDLRGQLMLTLFETGSGSGSLATRAWNGRDRDFELVPAGTYIVHLSVVDPKTGNEQTKTAPVVVATRLGK